LNHLQLKTRICEHCKTPIPIHVSDIIRGKGMFCCKSCAAHCRSKLKLSKLCKSCGNKFVTTDEYKEYCCVECKNEHSDDTNDANL